MMHDDMKGKGYCYFCRCMHRVFVVCTTSLSISYDFICYLISIHRPEKHSKWNIK